MSSSVADGGGLMAGMAGRVQAGPEAVIILA